MSSSIEELRARLETLASQQEAFQQAYHTVDGDAHMALVIARQNVRLMEAFRATQLEHGQAIAELGDAVTELGGAMTGPNGEFRAGQQTIIGLLNRLIGDEGS